MSSEQKPDIHLQPVAVPSMKDRRVQPGTLSCRMPRTNRRAGEVQLQYLSAAAWYAQPRSVMLFCR